MNQVQLTEHLAICCDSVIIEGNRNSVARVSIVNKYGCCIYDRFVSPRSRVINYQSRITGIKKYHLKAASDIYKVKHEVADLIRGRILVGHCLDTHLKGLGLSHPDWNKRDTSTFGPYMEIANTCPPELEFLAGKILNINIWNGPYSSVEIARVTMDLYCKVDTLWEALLEIEFESEEYVSSGYDYSDVSNDY